MAKGPGLLKACPTNYVVECESCRHYEYVGEGHKGHAAKELFRTGWRKPLGRWRCRWCVNGIHLAEPSHFDYVERRGFTLSDQAKILGSAYLAGVTP